MSDRDAWEIYRPHARPIRGWREAVAFHEAAHAVVSTVLGGSVWCVTIKPTHLTLGLCVVDCDGMSPFDRSCVDVAGLGGEILRHPQCTPAMEARQDELTASPALLPPAPPESSPEAIAKSDLEHAADTIPQGVSDLAGLGRRIGTSTANILRQHWHAVECIAAELLFREQISGDKVREIVSGDRMAGPPQRGTGK